MPPTRPVRIPSGTVRLDADVGLTERGRGLVLFAHGSGSGRASPRNRFVAEALERAGISTVLLDLLTSSEALTDERTFVYRFDIPRLARRLRDAVDWAAHEPSTAGLRLGLYGASTGGAAALLAAADRPEKVSALVLRGARSDLADASASRVRAPTLFVVGEADPLILEANRATARLLGGPHRISVVPRASHLFEEPGALETVAEETVGWFAEHLGPPREASAEPSKAYREVKHHLPS